MAPNDEKTTKPEKTRELRTFFFLTAVLFPVLAVVFVSAYGFAVWIYQMIAGPPGA